MSWSPPASGAAPAEYVIETTSGDPSAFVEVWRTTLPEFAATKPAAGIWQVRVRGVTAGGIGPPSPSGHFVTASPCLAAPGPPQRMASLTMASRVTLQWEMATTGGLPPPRWYVLEVGSHFGLSDLARVTLSGLRNSIEFNASSGVYIARVRGLDACGTSGPSNEVVVRVP